MFRLMMFILFVPLALRSQTADEKLMLSIGCDLKPDRYSPLEFNFKRISKSPFSFCGKISLYSYGSDIYPTFYTSIAGISWQDNYCSTHTYGATAKPGWIFYKRISEKRILYVAFYGVVSETFNSFTIKYLDVNGETNEVHNQRIMTVGTELEAHYSRILLPHFSIGVSLIAGLRQNNISAFNNVINNYRLFATHTPSQGFSDGPFYLMMGIGIGIPF